ncbi:hypothetical protein [Chenggangzhangella methanolivorans]|uniref:Uncharacterized protein n=1 Tax=Chenggangzhangella methanolivorans TaxID=1437009 RepID=A0A9E6R9E9_9HYPH|nr:hypothetical protein [Chenggangzhangella methanolivorans]QZO00220.1 hypothetical protein K6K41_27535 [Chenggangzhangella methanolivorans]
MRTEIDLHVMQDIGAIIRAGAPAIEPLSAELKALLEALRRVTPQG